MDGLRLQIVTPKGALLPVSCDSIRLTVCDGRKGKGGGSYGIRKGHTKALFSLDVGEIRAFLSGKAVFAGQNGRGFATVERDVVTAVVETFCVSDGKPVPAPRAKAI